MPHVSLVPYRQPGVSSRVVRASLFPRDLHATAALVCLPPDSQRQQALCAIQGPAIVIHSASKPPERQHRVLRSLPLFARRLSRVLAITGSDCGAPLSIAVVRESLGRKPVTACHIKGREDEGRRVKGK